MPAFPATLLPTKQASSRLKRFDVSQSAGVALGLGTLLTEYEITVPSTSLFFFSIRASSSNHRLLLFSSTCGCR